MTKHDAPGPAAGYLYQPAKALLRLSKAPVSAWIGVETGDDVVEEMEGVVTASEQAKNASAGQGNPFADRSVGLWKTLSIWIGALETEPARVANARLILSTNRQVPDGCLARMLAAARLPGEIEAATLQLRETGEAPSKSIKEFVAVVVQTDQAVLEDIVSRIRIDDGTGLTNSVKGDTIEFLQLPTNVDESYVYDALLGWLSQALKRLWDAGEPGWISCKSFANQRQSIIENCHRDAFSARATRSITVSQDEQDARKGDRFVRQLQLIDVDDDETLTAISELIRESKEIIRLFEQGVITKPDFLDRDARLYDRWTLIYKRHKRSTAFDSEEACGYQIYDETTDHNEPLGTLKPIDRYMTAGALHRLANDPEYEFFVGWHPRYKELLETEDANVL